MKNNTTLKIISVCIIFFVSSSAYGQIIEENIPKLFLSEEITDNEFKITKKRFTQFR